jgi:hypothetical protein
MSESDEEETRSERLRRRRGSRTAERKEGSQSAEQDRSASSDDDQDGSAVRRSVKEEQVGTYMYLPQSQKKEVERLYNVLKADYEYEFDEPFEKNRHFFPLVIQYGLDELDSLDNSEIRSRLEAFSE